jgi:hypothetical protein
MNRQPDLFRAEPPAVQPLLGLGIITPNPCARCNGTGAVIGAGKGSHAASVMCVCGRHRGWLPQGVFNFLLESVRCFGRPTEPIKVRFGNTANERPAEM